MQDKLFLVSVAVLMLGMLFIGISGGIFRLRALSNKRAWDGKTKPFAAIGIVLSLIGIILVYITYPFE